jgi:predicted phosphodiesterase
MAKEFYRFIHLSDIHFGQERNGTRVIHDDARQKLIEDCAAFVRDHGPADGILVVGDIAFAGQPAEYKKAAEWLKAVAKAGGCEEFAVRTIPGNHDIDRKKVQENKYCRSAHKEVREIKLEQLDGTLDEHLAVTEASNALLPKVIAYREFAARFDCDFPSLSKPCWAKNYPLGRQFTLRILGMNSVQVCDADDNEGNMILGNNQYIIDESPNTVPVAMIHHPLTWFRDKAKAKPYLSRAPVLLFGHEHTQGFEKVQNAHGQEQLHVFSGAANPPEGSHEYPFRYNWLEFRLVGEPDKRQLRLSLWPKVWSFQDTRYVSDRQDLRDKQFHTFDVPCPRFEPEVVDAVASAPLGSAKSCEQFGEVTIQHGWK